MPEEEQISRRNFLSIATWTIGGLITVSLAIPSIAYIAGPALRKRTTENWILLGPTSKVEIGTPTLFKVNIESQVGWIVNKQELSVYVLTEDGRDYIAMSNICTHLGCRVRWLSEQDQFFCPCHSGIFDKSGVVVSGPPPRPLDRYQTKTEQDQLFILVEG